MRVLFVDDEPNVLDSIRRQLRKVCDIHTAASGEEALRLLKELGPVALVVSDMRMPGMNGAELLTKVRELYPDTVRMVLDEDVVTDTGETLMFRGEEVTRELLVQLRPGHQPAPGPTGAGIVQKLRVLIPA